MKHVVIQKFIMTKESTIELGFDDKTKLKLQTIAIVLSISAFPNNEKRDGTSMTRKQQS